MDGFFKQEMDNVDHILIIKLMDENMNIFKQKRIGKIDFG